MKEEGISINQFIASAASEKMSAFATLDYLEMHAKRAAKKIMRRIRLDVWCRVIFLKAVLPAQFLAGSLVIGNLYSV
jgi:hypothetical protein